MKHNIKEFHCIMPIANIPSVLKHGVLSHERASRLSHKSVAMQAVQDRRDKKQVPGGLKLHQYANLYFHARNPMLFTLKSKAESLCVLNISKTVLQLPNVVLADQNASSDYVRFLSVDQMDQINFDQVFAENWIHPDRAAGFQRKSAKCAELLVPYCVHPDLIEGASVVNEVAAKKLQLEGFGGIVKIDPHLFFQGDKK